MLTLVEVLGIYLSLALIAVSGIWFLIGRQGFKGLDDTDSPLAKFFRKRATATREPDGKPAPAH